VCKGAPVLSGDGRRNRLTGKFLPASKLTELKPKMAAKMAARLKIEIFKNEQNITINLVKYCIVFVTKTSFISFNHGF